MKTGLQSPCSLSPHLSFLHLHVHGDVCVFVFCTCLGHTSHEVMSLSEPCFPCLVRALKEIVFFKIHGLISLPYSLFLSKDKICNFHDCSTNRAF